MLPSSLPSHYDRLSSISSESGLEFINSLGTREHFSGLGIEGLDPILKHYGLEPGDIIDVFGGSCCGKTTLLYAICIATTLPRQWILRSTDNRCNREVTDSDEDVVLELGGKEKGVIFLDLDLNFDIGRLRQLFYHRIQSAVASQFASPQTDEDIERKVAVLQRWRDRAYQPCVDRLIESCLANVHIFSPSSASTTIATVKTLDQYLVKLITRLPSESTTTDIVEITATETPISTSAGPTTMGTTPPGSHRQQVFRSVSILLIDSLSAFYWHERPQNSYSAFLVQLDRALLRLRTRWNLIVLFTSWSLHPSPEIVYPESWRSKVKFRFTIGPKLLDRIPVHMDLVAMWRARFAEWSKQCHRVQQLTKEPWQISSMINGLEAQYHLQKNTQKKQDSPNPEGDLSQNDGGHSSDPEDLAKRVDDLDTARASFFQVQMAHPQPAAGRPWELFRFSVSDTDGVQFFHIPS